MKFEFGVYFTVPFTLVATVPLVPWVTLTTANVSPSTSVSLASTSISTAVSSLVVSLSSTATGLSLIAFINTVTVPVALPVFPSLMV